MNKKKLLVFGIMGLFAVSLIAAVGYYTLFSATFTVLPAITLSGVCEDTLGNVYSGDVIKGAGCTLTNDATTERSLVIGNNAVDGIEVSYEGSLTLAQKDLSTWVANGLTETIQYTIVGEEFKVTGIPTEYTLIYYPNTEGDVFTTNVANIKVLSEGTNVIENLPIELDVGDDYCNNGENPGETQCVGGKLWLISGTESEALAKLNSWDATEFYFETELIQYNAEGEITLSPGASLTLTPVYTIGAGVTGLQTIETTVA